MNVIRKQIVLKCCGKSFMIIDALTWAMYEKFSF